MSVVATTTNDIFYKHMDKIEPIMQRKNIVAGTYLFWEGDEIGKLYLLLSGGVKLTKTTEDGKNLILSILKEGDLVGEFGSMNSAFYSYNAEVIEDALIGIIEQSDLEHTLAEHGDLAIDFVKWLSTTNIKMQTKFRDLLLYGKTGALASTLIRMSNTYGSECEDGIYIEMKVNNTELADMIGATRESVNRMLGALRDDGTISMRQGHIVIHKIDELRAICGCPSFPRCPPEICRL